MDNMLNAAVVSRPSAAVVAGQSEVDGSSVDMQGLDEVTFLALVGTVTSGGQTTLKAQQSSDNGNLDAWADITGSSQQITDNGGKVIGLTVYRPVKRYVRPVVLRATANVVLDGIVALASKAKKLPVTQSSDVAASAVIAPAA